MCPSNYNRFWGTARYWSKIVIFSYPLAFDAPIRGVPVGIAPPRLVWKNWNGLATRWWKNFEDIFIRFGATHERVWQTDRHRVTEIAALCIASHGSKTILKPRLAAAAGRQYVFVGFSRRKISRSSAYTISEKAIRFRHPDYNPDRAQKSTNSSMSRHLSTRNISSKSMHAFLSNLANR